MTVLVTVLQVKTSVTRIPQYWIKIPWLFWNLSRDLIGPYGMLVCLLAVAKEEAAEDEGKGDSEPQTKEGQHGREGYLGTQQREQRPALDRGCLKNVKHVTNSAR